MTLKWTASVEHKDRAVQEFYVEEVEYMKSNEGALATEPDPECCEDKARVTAEHLNSQSGHDK